VCPLSFTCALSACPCETWAYALRLCWSPHCTLAVGVPVYVCVGVVRAVRRVTADLLCSTNGLEKLAKISRDPGVFKRSGSVVGRQALSEGQTRAVTAACLPPIENSASGAGADADAGGDGGGRVHLVSRSLQAKDVRRVIQIYEGWARQLLPTVQFAQFVQQAENQSGNQKVQVKQMHLDQGYDDTWADTSVDAVSVCARVVCSYRRGHARAHTHAPFLWLTVVEASRGRGAARVGGGGLMSGVHGHFSHCAGGLGWARQASGRLGRRSSTGAG
jgi:hypothetical protein